MPTATLRSPKLWHFEHPHLYRLETELVAGDTVVDRHTETFGIRSFELKDGAFFLNGERIRPMGVERMAGSHPCFGMAEPGEWLEHDHRDMLELNCVFTRVHWPQDKRTLDFCNRHGILIQTELPPGGRGPLSESGTSRSPPSSRMAWSSCGKWLRGTATTPASSPGDSAMRLAASSQRRIASPSRSTPNRRNSIPAGPALTPRKVCS